MISSVDGKITVHGRVGDLTGPVDQYLLRRLRSECDVVLVGAETVRVEGYGSLGVEPAPALAIVSGSLAIPPQRKVLHDQTSPLFLLTSSDAEIEGATRQLHYLRGERQPLELRPLLEQLRQTHGIERVVCEGGPRLNGWLLQEGLVDELFLSVAPRIVGGASALTTVATSVGLEELRLALAGRAEDEDYVYLRYRVAA